MTSATEVLRRLLDERGVEWEDGGMPSTNTTFIVNGVAWHAMFRDGGIELHCEPVTPEQAIAATLGAGTCHMELPDLRGPAFTDVYICSECGGEVMVGTVMGESDVPKWCPWCGRKVVGA